MNNLYPEKHEQKQKTETETETEETILTETETETRRKRGIRNNLMYQLEQKEFSAAMSEVEAVLNTKMNIRLYRIHTVPFCL